MKSKQSGVTLMGFLIILIVLAFFGFMAMKLVPSYTEFMGVTKAMNQIASTGAEGRTLDDLRRDLIFKMGFQYVDDSTVKPADITLLRDNGATQLHVEYEKVVPFMYNISFLLEFEKSVPLKGHVGQ